MPNTADAGSDNLVFRCVFELEGKLKQAAIRLRTATLQRFQGSDKSASRSESHSQDAPADSSSAAAAKPARAGTRPPHEEAMSDDPLADANGEQKLEVLSQAQSLQKGNYWENILNDDTVEELEVFDDEDDDASDTDEADGGFRADKSGQRHEHKKEHAWKGEKENESGWRKRNSKGEKQRSRGGKKGSSVGSGREFDL